MGYHYKYKEYIYRHMYPKKSSALFTYHRHPDGRGGFLDDGICELCGTRGRTVLIERMPLDRCQMRSQGQLLINWIMVEEITFPLM